MFFKEIVEGIILVISCNKHINTRLREFRYPKNNYNNWKVIYVIGDLFMNNDYEFRHEYDEYDNITDTFMYIRCEDSYIHLLKKLSLALTYLYENFEIKQGVLRSNDDLIINENKLIEFLNGHKEHYVGQNDYCIRGAEKTDIKKTRINHFMNNYYYTHTEDFDNVLHNLKDLPDLVEYVVHPDIQGAAGSLFYISNKCCNYIINHMKSIDYNVFTFDKDTGSAPYTVEDIGVAYILYSNNIKFTNKDIFFDKIDSICYHTNKYQ